MRHLSMHLHSHTPSLRHGLSVLLLLPCMMCFCRLRATAAKNISSGTGPAQACLQGDQEVPGSQEQ
jgi:hypothetical protein